MDNNKNNNNNDEDGWATDKERLESLKKTTDLWAGVKELGIYGPFLMSGRL